MLGGDLVPCAGNACSSVWHGSYAALPPCLWMEKSPFPRWHRQVPHSPASKIWRISDLCKQTIWIYQGFKRIAKESQNEKKSPLTVCASQSFKKLCYIWENNWADHQNLSFVLFMLTSSGTEKLFSRIFHMCFASSEWHFKISIRYRL